jgi:putative ABC transport system permease protein
VRPLLGRTFAKGEAQTGTPRVVVLSEQLWRERFAADSAILGRSASFDGVRRHIIGVLPASFTYGRPEQYWVPLRVAPVRYAPNAESGEVVTYTVVARLRNGVPLEAVRLELAPILARLAQEDFSFASDNKPVVMTLHARRYGETRRPLLLLFGAVGVLLLTACANIANLSLARAARREREFAMRLALGASRWRIVSFVLIENLALAAGGAILGLLLVTASLGWFVRVSPDAVRNVDAIGVDGALIAFTSVVAIVTALLFGLVPALTAARAGLSRTLASATQNTAGSKRQSVARRTLVVGELAIALVFLTGAGLVAKTFWQVTAVDPGLRPEKLLVADIELPENRYTYATANAFFDDLLARVRREPGVLSVAYADAPQIGSASSLAIVTSGTKQDGKPRWVLGWGEVAVGPEYFETIGAELVAGRFFGPDDRAGAPRVAVVSEQYVREQLAGAPAIGRTIDDARQRTIVGVVKDVSRPTTEGRRYPLVYMPLAQFGGSQDDRKTHRSVFVRTRGEPEQLQAPIRAAVQALDAAQPAPTFATMERTLAERVTPRRFTLVLLNAFAALAGSLAVIGLYSVLAYLVAERTREIGIRMAVGADQGRVTRMILGQGLRLTLIGAILGGLVSIAAVRVLRAWMYEMSVYDAQTFVAVAVLLCAVALIASWLPARRASRVDPALALRAD